MLDDMHKSIIFDSLARQVMNRLPLEKQVQIIGMLVVGSSLRSTSRVCDVSINTVTKLLVDVGQACQLFHDDKVRGLPSKRVQLDEVWSFVYSKQDVPQHLEGRACDVWTWTASDADSKLIVSWLAGNRDTATAHEFIAGVANRLANRIQLTTDGNRLYVDAVDNAFGADVDYAMLVKRYGKPEGSTNERPYSPAECTGAINIDIMGKPYGKHVSTSYMDRANLTMRMSMRRFTRLTNGFSKKIENHGYAIALHFVHYNFCKEHKSLNGLTPADAAGIYDGIMKIEDIVKLVR